MQRPPLCALLLIINRCRGTHCELRHPPWALLFSKLISMFLAILWSNSCYLNLCAKKQYQNQTTSLRPHSQHQKQEVVATRNQVQNEHAELCFFYKFSPKEQQAPIFITECTQGWEPDYSSQVLTAQSDAQNMNTPWLLASVSPCNPGTHTLLLKTQVSLNTLRTGPEVWG